MTLRDLDLELDYRSSHGRLVDQFYVPALRVSREYLRAAGYFTSRSLSLVAAGLPAFIAVGGHLRLVSSPVLEPADVDALTEGYEARDDVLSRVLLRRFEPHSAEQIERERLGFLAWMVANGHLDIRIALRVDDGFGIYHEKFGVMEDLDGNAIAFTGSPNETAGGLARNFESIDVFRSWVPGEAERVDRKALAFDDLWTNRTPGLATFDLPDAVRERLIELRPPSVPRRDPLQSPSPEPDLEGGSEARFAVPSDVGLRWYQIDAIEAWKRAGRLGILEMATGTGKTITALAAAADALAGSDAGLLVIAAPYLHLVDQWVSECERFGLHAIACYGSARSWLPRVTNELDLLSIGVLKHATLVVTHASIANQSLRDEIARSTASTMLIADEVHHLGAAERFATIEGIDFEMRLGLSATPRRWFDPDGDDRLTSYFGDIVFEFGLAKAIAGGFLTPYNYDPILVELTADETSKYRQISQQIAAALSGGADLDSIGPLLRRRSEVLNGAEAKLPALASLYPAGCGASNLLVYTTPSRLDDVVRLLSQSSRLRVRRFTFRENPAERQSILRQFESGVLDALVAIRCLDEGVDVPGIREAVLTASSSNPREFIQRRGRILRRAPGKISATIHDLITVPVWGDLDDGAWTVERRIVKREFARFVEFADNAQNAAEARRVLMPIQDRYHLLDM